MHFLSKIAYDSCVYVEGWQCSFTDDRHCQNSKVPLASSSLSYDADDDTYTHTMYTTPPSYSNWDNSIKDDDTCTHTTPPDNSIKDGAIKHKDTSLHIQVPAAPADPSAPSSPSYGDDSAKQREVYRWQRNVVDDVLQNLRSDYARGTTGSYANELRRQTGKFEDFEDGATAYSGSTLTSFTTAFRKRDIHISF